MKQEEVTILNVHMSKEEVAQCVQLASAMCDFGTVSTNGSEATITIPKENYKNIIGIMNNLVAHGIMTVYVNSINSYKTNIIVGRDK